MYVHRKNCKFLICKWSAAGRECSKVEHNRRSVIVCKFQVYQVTFQWPTKSRSDIRLCKWIVCENRLWFFKNQVCFTLFFCFSILLRNFFFNKNKNQIVKQLEVQLRQLVIVLHWRFMKKPDSMARVKKLNINVQTSNVSTTQQIRKTKRSNDFCLFVFSNSSFLYA